MLAATTVRRLVIATILCSATLSSAMAQNMVSVKGSTLTCVLGLERIQKCCGN